jgi:hypothetical protein
MRSLSPKSTGVWLLGLVILISLIDESFETESTSLIKPNLASRLQKIDKFLALIQNLLKRRMSASPSTDRRSVAESRMFFDFLLDPSMMVTILHSLEMAYWSLPFGFLLMPLINFFRVPNRRRSAAARLDSLESQLKPEALRNQPFPASLPQEAQLAHFLRNHSGDINSLLRTPLNQLISNNPQLQQQMAQQLQQLQRSGVMQQLRTVWTQLVQHPKQLQRLQARLQQTFNTYRHAINRRLSSANSPTNANHN